ncbi:MAG: mercury methylation ferredoxin HgcB [candidate division KSB1 bacterium]|nr:mercury methylation ferredoxin HgcB [candidate division KSB1 bacterium]
MNYLRNVTTLQIDSQRCTACGMCTTVCPRNVLHVEDTVKIQDPDACIECGACQMNCVYGAISVNSGVGCAAAVINGMIRGTEPNCGCGDSGECCC